MQFSIVIKLTKADLSEQPLSINNILLGNFCLKGTKSNSTCNSLKGYFLKPSPQTATLNNLRTRQTCSAQVI